MAGRLTLAICMLAATVTAGEVEFSLQLDSMPLRPADPRTEARLAQWNSPLGRVSHHLAQEQAMLGRGGLVGGGVPQVAVGVDFVQGLPPRVVASVLASGVPQYEQTVAAVRWPWSDETDSGVGAVLSLERQLGVLLGHRLESRPPGGEDPPAVTEGNGWSD